MANTTKAAGSGWFSRLVLLALLGLTVGLYLRIVMPPAGQAAAPASLRVVESAPEPAAPLQPLPEDQMKLVRDLFAPELAK
jgi:hypothetical protein